MGHQTVSGWGRSLRGDCRVVVVDGPDEVTAEIAKVGPRGALGRGLGRSYGDSAINSGGLLMTLPPDEQLSIDDQGVLRVGAGASFDTLLRWSVPKGWFVPVTPGTRQVTVGGAIAADLHGKNHHRDGSLGAHLRSITLCSADGEISVLTPDREPGPFWATVGGMGLTGLIVAAEIKMRPIETSRLLVDTDRTINLEDTLTLLESGDSTHGNTVAWLDLTARGSKLGRGVVSRGDFAPTEALDDTSAADPLAFAPRSTLALPPWIPPGTMGRLPVRAFNELWYRKAPKRRRNQLQTIGSFFHPLDAVSDWNRAYGSSGFVQWQVLIPFGREDLLAEMVAHLATHRTASMLTVLKRFGSANPAPLSFPAPGWTLAVDLAIAHDGRRQIMSDFDKAVVGAGGRIYLAKDSGVDPGLVRAMYPRLDEWRVERDRLDPQHRFQSDQSRRLGLSARLL